MRLQSLLIAAMVLGGLAGESRADVLFQDDFSDGVADGWEEFDGVFLVVNGMYEIDSTTAGFVDGRSVAMTSNFTNFSFETEFENLASEPGRTALLFRIVDIAPGLDGGHYYQFQVDTVADVVGFCRIADSGGNCEILTSEPFISEADVRYTVRVEVSGTAATAFINNVMVDSVAGLTDYLSGRVGLKTIGAISRFDNVAVSALGPPTPVIFAEFGTQVIGGNGFFERARARADLDGDGNDDLIFASWNCDGPIRLSFLPGIGDGTFGARINLFDFTPTCPVECTQPSDFLDVYDVDGDTDVDIVLSRRCLGNLEVHVWKNEMAIPFSVADFDKDGDVDLSDFSAFALCFGGANNPPPPGCPQQ